MLNPTVVVVKAQRYACNATFIAVSKPKLTLLLHYHRLESITVLKQQWSKLQISLGEVNRRKGKTGSFSITDDKYSGQVKLS